MKLLKLNHPFELFMFLFFGMFTGNTNAQWINTGIEGGFHLSLGVSPVNSNFVLAGGDMKGGIYRTINAGGNWEYAGHNTYMFFCFAFDPQNQNIAFAGSTGGLFKSVDQGFTWTKVAFDDTLIFAIQFNPLNPSVLYVGTGNQAMNGTGYGVFISTNGGNQFTYTGLAPNLITGLLVSDSDTSKVLASCGSGVFLSTNSGGNWTFNGPAKGPVGLPTSTIAWNGADTMYTCTFYQPGDYYQQGAIYRSTDGGTTWDSLYAFLSEIKIGTLEIAPNNPNIVYVGIYESFTIKPGIWMSSDAGATWQYKSNGITDLMIFDVAIDRNNPSILYTTGNGGGGIYKTTDGGNNWLPINTGMTYYIGYQTKHFSINFEHYIYSINSFGVSKTIPQVSRLKISTGTWESCGIMTIDTTTYNQTMFSIFDIAQDPNNDSLMYAGGMTHSGSVHNYPSQGIFYRSTDEGLSWQPPYYFDTLAVNTIEVVYNGTQQIILVGTGSQSSNIISGVWKSQDGGLSFTQTTGWFPGVQVWDIETDPFNSSNIIAATVIGIFKSVDYGSSWSIFPGWNADSMKVTYRILMDTTTPGRAFTANGGWLVNTDTTDYGGVNWSDDYWNTMKYGGLNHFNATGLAMCDGKLFVGLGGQFIITIKDTIHGHGVWYTDINQFPFFSWQPLDTAGMPWKFILSLTCYDSIIYAGTFGGGVWKYDISQIVTGFSNEFVYDSLPIQGCDLQQNYPNPFNRSTTIRFSLLNRGHITLKVLDVFGREVTTLVDGVKEPGLHHVQFNANDLSSGMYFLQIRNDNFVQTKKLEVIR